MQGLARIILVRHGETTGRSSVRYYGATDVPLSALGRAQAREAARRIPGHTYERVYASVLSRAWQTARIVAPRQAVHLEADFREVDFGRWEGLTRDEIEALDPERFAVWQSGAVDFAYPDGESREAFRARVARGLERLRASGVRSALVVAHKGVVRTLLELVTSETLPPAAPSLGGVVHAYRGRDGVWTTGRVGSDPSCGEAPVGRPPANSSGERGAGPKSTGG